jgi:hypothetical protein
LLAVSCLAAKPGLAQSEPKQPKYAPSAVRLFHAREYLREHDAPDFWALTPYYASQPDDRSCSAASVAMLVNALRAERTLGANDSLATAVSVLNSVEPERWKHKLAPDGAGVTLDELAALIPPVLKSFGIDAARVETLRFADAGAESVARWRRLLVENEQSSGDLVLVNYLQSTVTGDPEGAVGHIAPVGAYDATKRRVLLFDPDRQWYEPYWTPDETLLQAMTTPDPVTGQLRGLVHIIVKPTE